MYHIHPRNVGAAFLAHSHSKMKDTWIQNHQFTFVSSGQRLTASIYICDPNLIDDEREWEKKSNHNSTLARYACIRNLYGNTPFILYKLRRISQSSTRRKTHYHFCEFEMDFFFRIFSATRKKESEKKMQTFMIVRSCKASM